MSYHKFDGRYLAKNGELIVVHEGKGHTVIQNEEKGTIIEATKGELEIIYDHKGDCIKVIEGGVTMCNIHVTNKELQEKGFYLVERVNPQSLLGQMKIRGCDRCENAKS